MQFTAEYAVGIAFLHRYDAVYLCENAGLLHIPQLIATSVNES